MPVQNLISQMYFKINGTSASASMMRSVREIVVDTGMYLPDMFSIQLNDLGLHWIDSADLEIGKTIEISGKTKGEGSAKILTKGEVVAIEPEFDQESGTTITIRGYDKSHRLHRGKKNRVFAQVKDSDIVQKITMERGIQVEIDSTSVVYDHVFQHNQTDMEFIHERARCNGFQAYVENDKLYFKKAANAPSSGATLEWGKNLTHFQARFSGAGQVSQSEVHGWDMKQKKAVVGSRKSPEGTPVVASEKHGGKLADSAFGSAPGLFHSQAVNNQAEAENLAQARLNENCQNFFQAEGICLGNPEIRAGKLVEIKGVGKRFSGKYMVTRAVHRYDFCGYTTEFDISGHRANTLAQLLFPSDNQNACGMIVGLVTNSKDPDGLARVKVKFPSIDENLESHWARLAAPMAGNGMGFEFIPEVNDEVLVAFEHNDFNKPYVIGSLWNGLDKPPEDNNNIINQGKVQKRIIKSRSGHIITLDDTDKGEKISIVDKSGQSINIDSSSGKEKIEIIDKTGKSKIIMDASKQSVSIESAKDLTIKALGILQIEANAGIDMKTNAKLQVDGTGGIDIKSSAQTNIKGSMTSVQGTATAELKSSGILTVQGSLVKIN
jgi:phage protein D